MYTPPDVFRSAIRLTREHPAFVALVSLILGVGIGATAAALNVARSVVFTPLPVADESRLVLIAKTTTNTAVLMPFSYAEIAAWRDSTHTLETVAGVQYDGAWPWPAQFHDRAFSVTGAMVTGDFFAALGARPVLGRLLTPDDAKVGSDEVAVLGYTLWRGQFGGDPRILGQRIRLNGHAATIIGVARDDFAFPRGTQVWQPLIATPDVLQEGWFTLVARLKPNVTVQQAAEESSMLLERLRSVGPRRFSQEVRPRVMSLRDAIVGDIRPVTALFVGAAAVLYLVGCINVLILLLIRGAAREREIVVCVALGATRGTLVRQLMLETAVLAVFGGALAAIIAFWLQRGLVAAAPAAIPGLDRIHFNEWSLGAALVGLLLAVLLAGVAPALWTVRRALFSRLREAGAHGTAPRGQVGRQLLVAAQLGFALLVTIAGAQLVRTLQHLQALDLGFSVDRLNVVQVPLVGQAYADAGRRRQLFEQLAARVQTSPGIAAATPVLLRPFTGTDGWDATFTGEGQRADEASANPGLDLEAVEPNYFAAMGVPIEGGRAFTESDRQGGLPVAIITESLARQAWRDSSALGKRLKFGGADSPAPWMTVVGVVRDLRYRDLKAPPPTIYVPLRQSPFPPRFLIVRASLERAPILAIVQGALKELDAAEPVTEAASIGDLLSIQLSGPAFHMFSLSLFAGVAVLLAGVGVFGVLGAFVAQRSREVGLRVALGANRRDIRRLVLSKIGWPVALGLVAGTLAAFVTMPYLRPLLFRVGAFDPMSLVAGWIGVILITALASLLPLQRAAQIDPVTLLRSE